MKKKSNHHQILIRFNPIKSDRLFNRLMILSQFDSFIKLNSEDKKKMEREMKNFSFSFSKKNESMNEFHLFEDQIKFNRKKTTNLKKI